LEEKVHMLVVIPPLSELLVVAAPNVPFVEDGSATVSKVTDGVVNVERPPAFGEEDTVTMASFVIVGDGVVVVFGMLDVTDTELIVAIVVLDVEIVPMADEGGAAVFVPPT
jgi:hypothetical protein